MTAKTTIMPLPVLLALNLLALTAVVALADRLLDQQTASKALAEAHKTLTPQVEQAKRIEKQLDALAGGTAKLAENGNVHAQSIVQLLQMNGIDVKAPK